MDYLVAIDFSSGTDIIIASAARLAIPVHAKLWLVHAADPDPDFVGYEVGPQTVRDAVASSVHTEHRKLQEYADEIRDMGIDCTALLVQGPTVETILHEAEKLSAGIIILGSHGKGALIKMLVGSTSEGVLRKSTVPVLVVPTRQLD
jgi:nucleotide-binding universal stress UspA family protein